MAVSADCKLLVSGSGDNTIKVCNLQERKEECTLTGHTGTVASVALSADGRFIVSGSSDKTIRIWNIRQRREECTLGGHTGYITSVAVSADGRLVVSGSGDCTVRVWDFQERREEWVFGGHTGVVTAVAVSADGRFVVSGSEDESIRIWNVGERREECTLTGQRSGVRSVAVSADGKLVVSGSCDKISIWKVQEQKEEGNLIGCRSDITAVAVSEDGRFIASVSSDNKIKIWNTHDRVTDCTLKALNSVQKVIISADGKFIISKGADCTVQIWNLKTKKKERFSLKQHLSLLSYILEIVEVVNCEVVATPDLLLLRSEFGVIRTALINSGDLHFSFDLGVNFSESIFVKYNFIYYARTTEVIPITSAIADRYYGILRFTLTHYFSYSGDESKLKLLVECDTFLLAVDVFYKSPFYYAIVKKRQNCVDLLLEKIEQIRLQYKKNYELSILAIRSDLPLIIKNSPRQLNQLLFGLMQSSSLIYAKVPDELPILQLGSTSNVHISDFPKDGSEDTPVLLQNSIFGLMGESGCSHNTELLEAIINCKNPQALRNSLIYYIVAIQFNSVRIWVLVYTVLLALDIILLMFLIGLKSFDISLVIPFLLVNASLFLWEIFQMATDAQKYFQDYWNYLDIARNAISVIWIVLGLFGISSLYFTWSVALLNLLRGITVFRLFDGTRFYIELIFRSLNDIKYFFLMFAYSTFTFGFLLMISRDQGLGFNSIWGESYDLNFGNYEGTNSGVYFMQYIGYFGATVINVVLMLNLLISILGDSYERFQVEEAIVDIKEKARISLELQLMMFWANRKSRLKCIRLCISAFQDEDEQDWEGRIRFMDKKLDKSIRELIESNKSAEIKATESIKSVESKVNDISISLEKKNTSVEGKISDVNISLEAKISDISTSLEGKISDISTSLEGKMNDLNQKLEIILNIISK